MSRLEQLGASAGSGKTYALTERFLALLDGAGEDQCGLACAKAAPSGYAWPEILAATFTNKAASEMKERVVAAIKRCALEIQSEGQKANWQPLKAEHTLDRMLRRYNQLNIRTIDSLLNLLLRVFALDAGLNPDFELIFDETEPFDAARERVVSACEQGDTELTRLYTWTLDTLLAFESDASGKPLAGFWLMDRINERLLDMVRHLSNAPVTVNTDQERIAELLVPAFDAYVQAAQSLAQCVEGCGADPVSNFSKFLNRCVPDELFGGVPSAITYATKDSLRDCVKKASQPVIGPAEETCYHDFKACFERYQLHHAVLARAYSLAPSVELASVILERMRQSERESGKVLNATLPGRVRELLGSEYGVPDAFCRLGGRLHHLLMDEFQDTSRDQWAAITPLAEECLAKGGSLFYVGDVKQAIYAWRGGDATLFAEVGSQPGLADTADEVESHHLAHNWRSKRRVVDFNNDFFTRLTDPEHATLLADAIFPSAPEEAREQFLFALAEAYQDAAQSVPDRKNAEDGYVRIERLPGGSREQAEEQTLDAFEALVADDLVHRRRLSHICALVRTKNHAELLAERLVGRGIPVVTESSLRLKRHPVPRQLAALLAFIDFPGNDLALAELLLGDLFLAAADLNHEAMAEWLARRQPGPLWLGVREYFPQAWELLAPFTRKAGLMTPYDLASDAARFFRVLERHPEAELFLKRFLEMVHRAGESGLTSLSAFLELWEKKGDEEKISLPESVDAVRIMTVHKAKGLQFPVVMVPFLHWPLRSDSEFVTAEIGGTSVLTTLTQAMGAPYHAARTANSLEQLNLLYVAMTRAEEELFAFYPGKADNRGGKAPAREAVALLLELDEEQPVYESGTPCPADPEAGLPAPHPPAAAPAPGSGEVELMAWLPRLRVYRHMEESGFDARMRGNAAHRAMELLRPTGDDQADALRARTLALTDFPVLAALAEEERARLEADIDAMLAWVLSRHDLRGWLATGRSEASFLDADGAPLRPDVLHLGQTENVILEFKTGGRDPAHAIQTRHYLRLVAQVFPDQPVRGVVVYLDLRETDVVEG